METPKKRKPQDRRVPTCKKPGIGVLTAAVVVCILVVICFLTDRRQTLPFMEKLTPVELACTEDYRGEQVLRRDLILAQREELSCRLRDLAHVERYESDTGNTIIPLYSLTAELEGLGTVTAEGISWDGTKVLLTWQDRQYRVEDAEFAQYLSRICSGGDTEAAAKQLSLNDVILLSQKGFDLTWSDLDGFPYAEIGSGLYIRRYAINDAFFLLIGGSHPEEKPWYIRLCSESGDSYVDVRQSNTDGAITFFIERYGSTPVPSPHSQLTQVRMDLEGIPLFCLTDAAALDPLAAIFDNAEWIGYDPQTYYLGPTVVLTYADGTELVAELDLYDDGCLIDGKYYDYGPGMDGEASVNATPGLLAAFGLTDWPQVVKAAYPQVFEPVLSTIPPENGLLPPDELWQECTMTVRISQGEEMDLPYPLTLPLLEMLKHVPLETPLKPEPDAPEYTLSIRFPGDEQYTLLYADHTFWLNGDAAYSFTYAPLVQELESAIANAQ